MMGDGRRSEGRESSVEDRRLKSAGTKGDGRWSEGRQ
jgi:hypothetical protein